MAADLRRQRLARRLVALGLALASGGTSAVLASMSGPAQAPGVAAVRSGGANGDGSQAVIPAGVTPIVSPSPINR